MNPAPVSDRALPGTASLATGSDALAGLAMLGKTAAALAFVIAVILLCSYLLRRVNRPGGLAGQQLQVVSSVAVGQKERVVVVEVAGTWLVLGVAGGQISNLHQLPAPGAEPHPEPSPAAPERRAGGGTDGSGFAGRFIQVLDRRNGRGRDPAARETDS
ncbi:MAG: flagellar biosynthetic protein FliO [Porticoccaceae bacterium]